MRPGSPVSGPPPLGPDGFRNIDFGALDRPDVVLTVEERDAAVEYGEGRDRRAAAHGWKDRIGHDFGTHPRGRCGEVAVAKLLGLHANEDWDAFKRGGDVAGYEVRTDNRYAGRLVFRPADPPGRIYILAVPMRKDLLPWRVWGWILGQDCKRDDWWDAPQPVQGKTLPPAWFVPAGSLEPMRTLPGRGAAA